MAFCVEFALARKQRASRIKIAECDLGQIKEAMLKRNKYSSEIYIALKLFNDLRLVFQCKSCIHDTIQLMRNSSNHIDVLKKITYLI